MNLTKINTQSSSLAVSQYKNTQRRRSSTVVKKKKRKTVCGSVA